MHRQSRVGTVVDKVFVSFDLNITADFTIEDIYSNMDRHNTHYLLVVDYFAVDYSAFQNSSDFE